MLDKALAQASIRREKCYVDNLVPCQPPANDFNRHTPGAVEWGRDRLYHLLATYKPKLVVALGAEASQALLGDQWPLDKRGRAEGIQKIRGYLWDTEHGRVLTASHPADILCNWVPWRVLLDLDFRKAKAEFDAGCPDFPERKVQIIAEPWQFQELRTAVDAAQRVAVDIENDRELRLSCLGVAVNPSVAYVVPARTSQQLAFIAELCSSDKPKILQNGQYDRFFLRRFADIELKNQTIDAMLQWHSLNPELAGSEDKLRRKKKGSYSRNTQKSLRFLASIFTRQPWFKNYNYESNMDQYILNGTDCCVTYEVAEILERHLARESTSNT